jgi:hypothetical protein
MPVCHLNRALNEVIKMVHEVVFQHRHVLQRNAVPQSQQLTTVETK